MIYLGGKNRLGPRIAAELHGLLKCPFQEYVEPFIGGCGVFAHMTGPRSGSDIDGDIVAMWVAAKEGWIPPSTVTEDEYRAARVADIAPCLRGFIKYACSWGGKPWGGYARGNREYARLASVGVVAKAKKMTGTTLFQSDYRALSPSGALVYCDPPYAGTTQHNKFDSEEFWAIVHKWSETNIVVVSEYAGPDSFSLLREFPLRNKLNKDLAAVSEKLFVKVP